MIERLSKSLETERRLYKAGGCRFCDVNENALSRYREEVDRLEEELEKLRSSTQPAMHGQAFERIDGGVPYRPKPVSTSNASLGSVFSPAADPLRPSSGATADNLRQTERCPQFLQGNCTWGHRCKWRH